MDRRNPLLSRPSLLEHLIPVWDCWLWIHVHFREFSDWGAPRPLQPAHFEWYTSVQDMTEVETWRVRRYLPVLDLEYRRLESERRARESPAPSK